MPRFLLPLLLLSCSFAAAQDMPDAELRPNHEPMEVADQPIYADAHSSCVQAQLDAEAMLADVRAAHDHEADLVLRARER